MKGRERTATVVPIVWSLRKSEGKWGKERDREKESERYREKERSHQKQTAGLSLTPKRKQLRSYFKNVGLNSLASKIYYLHSLHPY